MRPKPKRRGFPLGLAAQAIVVFLLAAGAALALSTGWNPLAALTAASSAPGAPITAAEIIIVDGDTIRVAGERVRLVGFDAPETRDARCAREKELGDQATKRLTRLVDFGDLDFRKVPCSCPPGTEGTSRATTAAAAASCGRTARTSVSPHPRGTGHAVRVRRDELSAEEAPLLLGAPHRVLDEERCAAAGWRPLRCRGGAPLALPQV